MHAFLQIHVFDEVVQCFYGNNDIKTQNILNVDLQNIIISITGIRANSTMNSLTTTQ